MHRPASVIESNGLDLRYFSIIYDVIDQVKQVASGLLGVEMREEIIGIAAGPRRVPQLEFGAVAGCMVIEGVVKRNKPIRVLRDNTVIFEGELESLRRFKENVDEVRNGTECGIGVKAVQRREAGRPDRVLRAYRSAAHPVMPQRDRPYTGRAVQPVDCSNETRKSLPRAQDLSIEPTVFPPSSAASWARWCTTPCVSTACPR